MHEKLLLKLSFLYVKYCLDYYTDWGGYMERLLLDQGWEYRKGFLDMASTAEDGKGILVDLPYDAMIEGDVSDDRVTFGEYNRITVNLNTTMNENSRWYTGTGLYRSVELCHSPRIHALHDGIFMYTKEIGDVTCTDDVLTADYALIDAKVMIENSSYTNSIVDVILEIAEESGEVVKSVKSSIYVAKGTSEPASFSFAIDDPKLWDAGIQTFIQLLPKFRTPESTEPTLFLKKTAL